MPDRGLDEDVVRMGNQIAREFAYLPDTEAAAKVAYHLHAFWEPRMVAKLERHIERHPEDVEPVTLLAIRSLEHGAT